MRQGVIRFSQQLMTVTFSAQSDREVDFESDPAIARLLNTNEPWRQNISEQDWEVLKLSKQRFGLDPERERHLR